MNFFSAEVEEKHNQVHDNFLKADADKSGGLDAKEFVTSIDANVAIHFGRTKEIQKRKTYAPSFIKVTRIGISRSRGLDSSKHQKARVFHAFFQIEFGGLSSCR